MPAGFRAPPLFIPIRMYELHNLIQDRVVGPKNEHGLVETHNPLPVALNVLYFPIVMFLADNSDVVNKALAYLFRFLVWILEHPDTCLISLSDSSLFILHPRRESCPLYP